MGGSFAPIVLAFLLFLDVGKSRCAFHKETHKYGISFRLRGGGGGDAWFHRYSTERNIVMQKKALASYSQLEERPVLK
jgi:hypothetical protein